MIRSTSLATVLMALAGALPVRGGETGAATPSVAAFVSELDPEALEGVEPDIHASARLASTLGGPHDPNSPYGIRRSRTRYATSSREAWSSPGAAVVMSAILPGSWYATQGRTGLTLAHLIPDLVVVTGIIAANRRADDCAKGGWAADLFDHEGRHYHPYKIIRNVLVGVAVLHRIGCAIECLFQARRARARSTRSYFQPWASPSGDFIGASLTCTF